MIMDRFYLHFKYLKRNQIFSKSNDMFNKMIAAILPYLPKKFIWMFSKSYISGETIEDAMRVSKELNSKGIRVTLDVLGEFIPTLDEADSNKKEYLNLIDVTL